MPPKKAGVADDAVRPTAHTTLQSLITNRMTTSVVACHHRRPAHTVEMWNEALEWHSLLTSVVSALGNGVGSGGSGGRPAEGPGTANSPRAVDGWTTFVTQTAVS
jgi:hypothetical protein